MDGTWDIEDTIAQLDGTDDPKESGETEESKEEQPADGENAEGTEAVAEDEGMGESGEVEEPVTEMESNAPVEPDEETKQEEAMEAGTGDALTAAAPADVPETEVKEEEEIKPEIDASGDHTAVSTRH